ncbi:hypothetical protein HJFPF1_04596 [Paramyrothecium foliicola]|nr:hypothetical protein HJFPF1_04596 [Paramyrothecium foliicola]
MPATNRRVVRLTQPDTTSKSGDYLNSLSPSWITLQTALCLCAFFLVLLVCARRLYSWFAKPSILHSNQVDFPEEFSQRHAYVPAWPMDEKYHRPKGGIGAPKGQHVSFAESEPPAKTVLAIDPGWKPREDSLPRQLMTRPPPAPPLTPPELSNAVFTFDDRPRSSGSFIHQPNPDYTSSSTTTSASQSNSASPPTPRRRSYNKTLPIGVPMPLNLSSPDSEPADLTFSPSSYPPTSPILPPPPPGSFGPEGEAKSARGIDVRGEIISVLDGEGAGWTRHTRVYGGGVCLACAASGGDHSGGFYGATVRPEEMR